MLEVSPHALHVPLHGQDLARLACPCGLQLLGPCSHGGQLGFGGVEILSQHVCCKNWWKKQARAEESKGKIRPCSGGHFYVCEACSGLAA